MRELWRGALIAAGVLISWGGSLHPGGTMEEMLADPQWRFGHMLVFAGFAAMTAGIWLWARTAPATLRRVAVVAVAAAALQSLEMFVHAMADVDLENLRAGAATPVLSSHLMMTAVIYPIFALATIAFIVSTARQARLGSKWIAWLGVLGAAMHGTAGFLVVVFGVGWARDLFAGVVLLALWMIVAGAWPSPRGARMVEGV